MKTTLNLLEAEIARAESVVAAADGEYKRHAPTIDNHRGQLLAYTKVKHFLENEEITPQGTLILERKLTADFPWLFVAIFIFLTFINFNA
jgi:hypothetical protein